MSNEKKRFRLYDWLNRDGKGVTPDDVITTPNLKGFFFRYKLNFGKLLSVNIIYVIGNALLLFLLLTFAGYTKIPFFRPTNDTFGLSQGIIIASGQSMSALELLMGECFTTYTSGMANTTLTYVFWCISSTVLLTFGCVNTGCAYVLRNISRSEPVFVWSDFWHAVKQNYKQAIPLGIIDAVVSILLPYNIYLMLASNNNYLTSLMLWMNIAIFILYAFMRYYIYVLLVTFDLKITKIIKNALIFSILGFKRNIVAMLGIIILILIECIFLLSGNGFLLPIAVAIPLMFLFSHGSFMAIFASYYVIKKYMIDTLPESEQSPTEA